MSTPKNTPPCPSALPPPCPPAPPAISPQCPPKMPQFLPKINEYERNTTFYLKISQSKEEVLDEIQKLLSTMKENKHGGPVEPVFTIVYFSYVQPILQNGPVCGLVAVGMAGEIYSTQPISLDAIFDTAKVNNMTKRGEMFSAQEMKELCKLTLNCKAEIINTEEPETMLKITTTLLNGDLVLVPYDAGPDHRPCERNGEKAHWAVLIGFAIFLPKDKKNMSIFPEFTETITIEDPLTVLKEEKTALLDILKSGTNTLHFIGRHGKSKHVSIWNSEHLIKSNQNLKEVGKKIKDNLQNYIYHPIENTLRSQIILLHR